MRAIKLIYEHKTAYGVWIRRKLIISDGKEYERVVNIIHKNKDEYRVIEVKHI